MYLRNYMFFCDASKKAYGAVYICQGDNVSFVIAKTRVVPMKSHTLPRLELMTAVAGSHLCKFLLKSLNHLNFDATMWSDSQITLHWLFSKKELQQFVVNRVNEIHKLLSNRMQSSRPPNKRDLISVPQNILFMVPWPRLVDRRIPVADLKYQWCFTFASWWRTGCRYLFDSPVKHHNSRHS